MQAGLTPAKDDNAALCYLDHRTLPIFKCVDYKLPRHGFAAPQAPLWEGVARLSRGGGLEKVDALRRRLWRRQLPKRGSLGGAPAGASGYFFFFAFAQPFLRTGRAGFSFFSTRVRVSVRAFLSLTGWLLQGGAPGPPRPAGPLSGFTRQCLP